MTQSAVKVSFYHSQQKISTLVDIDKWKQNTHLSSGISFSHFKSATINESRMTYWFIWNHSSTRFMIQLRFKILVTNLWTIAIIAFFRFTVIKIVFLKANQINHCIDIILYYLSLYLLYHRLQIWEFVIWFEWLITSTHISLLSQTIVMYCLCSTLQESS